VSSPDRASRLALVDGGEGVLLVRGELDLATAGVLRDRLDADPPVTVIDMAGVTFLDSSGISVLAHAHRTRPIRVRQPSAAVRRVLELAGLADWLDPADRRDVADDG
jgi:anti-anti-sigma factor